jgi:glycosyltransferase involved in cell wall biosynthesis
MKIDVLFSPMNIMPVILKLSKIKKILVIHSNLPWLFPKDVPGSKLKLSIQRFFTNISINISNRVIVDSLTAKKELGNIFKNLKFKMSTVYLGLDQTSASFNFKNKDLKFNKILDEPYILTISSAVKYHCLKELIIAYESLCKDDVLIPKYIILSKNLDSNYYNEISKMVENSNYSEKIILLEDIEKEKISLLYKNASMYIFSSYCEVFGLTNLEAMQFGVPVLTSNKSAIPEICGSAAIYFDPHNPNDIKNKIIELNSNNELRERMVINGYEQIKKYSWEKTFEKTLKLIKN